MTPSKTDEVEEMVEEFIQLQDDLLTHPENYDTDVRQTNIDWFRQCLVIAQRK